MTNMSHQEAMTLMRSKMGWREWEQQFDGLLREGGWEWWADRVIPVGPIRGMMQRFGLSKRTIDSVIAYIQSVNRKPGLPDRVVAKTFQRWQDVPIELATIVQWPEMFSWPSPFTFMGFVELKTGKAKPTKEQRRWLNLAHNCPGCFSLVARPEQLPYLRKVLISE